MAELLFKEESYKIIGACFEVHKALGHGFKEVVYKDALEIELGKNGMHLLERNLIVYFIRSKN